MRNNGTFNNVQPRGNFARLAEQKDVSTELVNRLARMEGAHLNGLENLPFFGLAVLAGNLAGIDNYTLNKVSGFYILSRIIYNYLYINTTTPGGSNIRSLVWVTSLGFPVYLFGAAVQSLQVSTGL